MIVTPGRSYVHAGLLGPASGSPPRNQQCVGAARGLGVAFALIVLGWTTAIPTRADVVYTWNEVDGQDVQAELVVSSSVLTTGLLAINDVLSFSFIDNTEPPYTVTLDQSANLSFDLNVIRISQATGEIESRVDLLAWRTDPMWGDVYADLPFAPEMFNPQGPYDYSVSAGSVRSFYLPLAYGYWTVNASGTVPEPSALKSAGLGGICAAAWYAARRRRTRRNPAK